ncbi:hypothetical protein G7046_g9341 [Stylonectria norvegica]|nr:hypothetical protein G7046_g9341 [Stylonectria norvegica]
MDITKFVVEGRDKALLYGDYSTYHHQLVKRLLNSRKKLGIATKKRGEFQNKRQVTAEQIAQNHEYVRLLLLTSERAWAQAMSIKASHTTDKKGIHGRSRSHIISRLNKAANIAHSLVEILSQTAVSGASPSEILEAKAYAALVHGAKQFEKQGWELSLRSYATARIIYSALATATNGDIFKDLLSETIDPSIRYAAYQLKTPRTVPIPVIARRAFPLSDTTLVQEINAIDPDILTQGDPESIKGVPGAENAPKTLIWRSREVNIEDAQIALAWGSVLVAKERLAKEIASSQAKQSHEIAAAYDEILTATQDAVDATKQAIDEMRGEGIEQGDSRMQSLQITRTAVNFEMISWRIGRNRVLTGPHDGATEEYGPLRRSKKVKVDQEDTTQQKDLPTGKKLAKLKEKVALYDGTLQNIESIKELPGVANDQDLATQIDAFAKYFEALKSLSIARSHAIIGDVANALALINNAHGISEEATESIPASTDDTSNSALNVQVCPDAAEFLELLLDGELQRHRAIVHIGHLRNDEADDKTQITRGSLIERLHEYPAGGVDLTNIVEFPPKMALVPMKPIFLDVAWNYIEYPGKPGDVEQPAKDTSAVMDRPSPLQAQQQPKRGWFGFGRS